MDSGWTKFETTAQNILTQRKYRKELSKKSDTPLVSKDKTKTRRQTTLLRCVLVTQKLHIVDLTVSHQET